MSMWILVCDASRGALYETDKKGDDWATIGSYSHPESRLKSSELTSSEPGHSAKSKGGSRHTVMEPQTSPKEAEKEHFAQQLADVVNDGVRKKKYDRLVLVAPSHFTSLLEHHLSAETKKHLKAIIHKDYTFANVREAKTRLEEEVFAES